jgi:hypothetical protein
MAPEHPPKAKGITLADFSQKAIKKAVKGDVLQSPLFLYPATIGALSGMAMLAIGLSVPLAAAMTTGITLGAGGALFRYFFRREQIGRAYLNRMHQAMNTRRQQLLRELSERLKALDFQLGQIQLQQLQDKFQNFVGILNQALSPEEITHGRYLGVAEQVYLSSLDNLERAAGALASVRTIDLKRIEQRIRDIHVDGVVTEAESHEKQTLDQRRGLLEQQQDKVAFLIAQNEKAMTQLDFTAAAIADMKTRSGQASMDMETAIAELQQLIENAPKYNRID